ncbi:60S ribosomal protein L24B [Cymbomonas tetramitiformis]|uniref:60S ribosomal protein L24B n=1 Tax=Cymbomonas tetramitiformis TaxID=36881 RepID=A0AAE0L7D2_9CHLO|nr:60S ribosomal protein L24B [Cymbomonas tetramitiformis]
MATHAFGCGRRRLSPLRWFTYLTGKMVLKTESCRFSGLRIYPGHGMTLVRIDCQVFKFLNAKVKKLYNQRLKPSKLAWTFLYRKQHKKDKTEEFARKKRRVAKSASNRSITGVSVEVLQKKRSEKVEIRQAARDAALREIKERNTKAKAEKSSSKKSEVSKTKVANKGAKPAKGGKR